MKTQTEILQTIKETVLQILPDATVHLFGSRVTGRWTEESDWDVLILTKEKTRKQTKEMIQENLYQLIFSTEAYISSIIVSQDEWENSPNYYSLQKSIEKETIML